MAYPKESPSDLASVIQHNSEWCRTSNLNSDTMIYFQNRTKFGFYCDTTFREGTYTVTFFFSTLNAMQLKGIQNLKLFHNFAN